MLDRKIKKWYNIYLERWRILVGFIKRLSTGLFSPKEVFNYRNDKWYVTTLFFLFLLVLSILPTSIMFAMDKDNGFDYEFRTAVKRLYSGEEIPFQIEDNKLISTNNQEELMVKKLYDYYAIVFAPNKDYKSLLTMTEVSIVFASDGVYLVELLEQKQLFTYQKYPVLQNFDFQNLANYNSSDWEKIFQVFNNEYKLMMPSLVTLEIVSSLFATSLFLLFMSFILTFFQSFAIARFIRFSQFWKISIYLLTPYVFGYVLTMTFNIGLFYYIGMFMSAIYIIILGRSIGKEAIWKE